MGKKLALLLFGMSYCEYFHYFTQKNVKIDYKNSVENYKKFIFEYFENLGYQIDVFIATNEMNDNEKKNLLEIYKPIDHVFIENDENQHRRISRNEKFINAIELSRRRKDNNYDHILITRFDLMFKKKFEESNIHFDKFNLVSQLEEDKFVCDNFYFFPGEMLDDFKEICDYWESRRFHDIKPELEKKWGTNSIHYILNEHTWIKNLSFYKIVRTYI
tara:strand:- start:139 stop:789 length:651 start_codon:yes stop_codon:yes gene_type:complete